MMLAGGESKASYSAEALEARQRDIAGKPQRIEELAYEEVDDASRQLGIKMRTASGAADVTIIPGYMRTVAKHPDIFRCQMEMASVLFQGKIPHRERELAILRIGWLLRAPFEWGEHVTICKRHGITDEEVMRTQIGSSAPGWSKRDETILDAVEQLLIDQSISDGTWAALAEFWDEAQLIEFPMMVGQYVATALVQNALRIRLNDYNKGLTEPSQG